MLHDYYYYYTQKSDETKKARKIFQFYSSIVAWDFMRAYVLHWTRFDIVGSRYGTNKDVFASSFIGLICSCVKIVNMI